MQYQVPQFIEIEDKIFGPLTFKQFVFLLGGGAMCYLAYRFLGFFLGVFIIVPVGAFSLALAFKKVNNRPFIAILESAVRYVFSEKLYIWKKGEKESKENSKEVPAPGTLVSLPRLSESKLKDLTWSLDINESIYSKEHGGLKNREELSNTRKKKTGSDELSAFKGLSDDLLRQ